MKNLIRRKKILIFLFLSFYSSASQTKTPTETPPKTTPAVGSNRPRKTFQHLKTIQSFQTPARAMKAEDFLYQPAMDRKPYSVKRESLILEDQNGNYFIRVGSNNVFMEISIISLSSSSSLASSSLSSLVSSTKAKKTGVIHLHLLPDGTKRLAFHFAHLSKKEPSHNKPKLNQIYVELVTLLKERTNFPQLDLQSQYLRAITRVLEAAYFNFGKLDASEKIVLDQLAFELIIIKDEPPFGIKDKGSEEESEAETKKEGRVEKEAGELEEEQKAKILPKEVNIQITTEPNVDDLQSEDESSSSFLDSEQVNDQGSWLSFISENSKNEDGVYIGKVRGVLVSDDADNMGEENINADESKDSENIQLLGFPYGEGDAGLQMQVEPSAEKDDQEISVGSDSENILIVNNDHSDDSTQYDSDPPDSLLLDNEQGKDELWWYLQWAISLSLFCFCFFMMSHIANLLFWNF